jgi:hypothetical protein
MKVGKRTVSLTIEEMCDLIGTLKCVEIVAKGNKDLGAVTLIESCKTLKKWNKAIYGENFPL